MWGIDRSRPACPLRSRPAAAGGGLSSNPNPSESSDPLAQTFPYELPSTDPIQVTGLDVTHVEMTDVYYYVGNASYPTDLDLAIKEYRRSEMVCSPRGKECTVESLVVDGARSPRSGSDLGGVVVGYVQPGPLYDFGEFDPEEWPASVQRSIDLLYDNAVDDLAVSRIISGVGQFSASFAFALLFPSTSAYGHGLVDLAYGAAFGELHVGRPSETSGSATWVGPMFGTDMRYGAALKGTTEITYSFGDNVVDVEISDIKQFASGPGSVDFSYSPYVGPRSFSWNDLPVNNDGSFYIPGHSNDLAADQPHPTLGFIDGDFYGQSAEESAGVFERDFVSGAWLAIRGN